MKHASFGLAIWGMVLAFVSLQGSAIAQEHPEEHPTGETKSTVSTKDMAKAITNYVKKDTALKGGFFMVYDKAAKKPLALTLVKVHKEKLAKIAEGTYFACADFKTPDGKIYDLDVFMKGPSKDKLIVTEISVHKEDGKERYGWFEKKGVWHKKPMGGKEHPTKEHPEHPQKN